MSYRQESLGCTSVCMSIGKSGGMFPHENLHSETMQTANIGVHLTLHPLNTFINILRLLVTFLNSSDNGGKVVRQESLGCTSVCMCV